MPQFRTPYKCTKKCGKYVRHNFTKPRTVLTLSEHARVKESH